MLDAHAPGIRKRAHERAKMTCDGQQGMAVTDGSATVRWQLSSDVNDDRQTAWQVRVADALGSGTVYDSGTVTGSRLMPRAACYSRRPYSR